MAHESTLAGTQVPRCGTSTSGRHIAYIGCASVSTAQNEIQRGSSRLPVDIHDEHSTSNACCSSRQTVRPVPSNAASAAADTRACAAQLLSTRHRCTTSQGGTRVCSPPNASPLGHLPTHAAGALLYMTGQQIVPALSHVTWHDASTVTRHVIAASGSQHTGSGEGTCQHTSSGSQKCHICQEHTLKKPRLHIRSFTHQKQLVM